MGNRQNRAPGYIAVIPSEIRYDTALPPSAKLLYGEITALAGSDGYCWATNDYFAQLYGVDKCTISRWISKLQKRGHVTVEVVRGHDGEGAVEERRIYIGRTVAEAAGGIDKKINTYRQKDQEGIDEKVIANKDELTRENIPPIVPQEKSTELPEIKSRLTDYAGEDTELLSAIQGLLENRRVANKKPVKTLRALNGILKGLDRLSGGDRNQKLALLEHATLCNWLTVYPLRRDRYRAAEPEEEDSDVVW